VLHGGLWLSSVSKSERGQRLLLRDAVPQAAKARTPRLDAGTDGPALLRALLQSALEQVLVNASEVAEGVTAVETIHQLRVGLRRLRVVLRELAALSVAIAPQWDTVLSTAFTRLGELRDQVAVAAAVRPLLEAAGSPALDWHAPPVADPCATVREPSFQVVLLEILALAHADAAGYTPMSPKAARALVASRLTKLHGQVARGGRHFEGLPLAEQHRVRKRLKRLRYLADFTASLWPGRDATTYLRGLSEAQDALGLHNDVAVAAAAFERDAPAHPEAWFAAGYLQAHGALTARAAREALARAAEVPAFWT
jgi:CHAD domain-containing protein